MQKQPSVREEAVSSICFHIGIISLQMKQTRRDRKKESKNVSSSKKQSEKFRRLEKGVKEEDVCTHMREIGKSFKKLYVCI